MFMKHILKQTRLFYSVKCKMPITVDIIKDKLNKEFQPVYIEIDHKWLYKIAIVLLAIILRLIISSHPHSGENKPPQYGDYEAHRHWMEITINLPLTEWYTNSSSNNLTYWGLDYPPLQAYHSWLCGQMSKLIEPQSVKLIDSYGYQTVSHKAFMRLTVLISDIIFMFTAVLKLFPDFKMLMLILLYPGLILIDYGHFQYNCCSLGLVTWAVLLLKQKRYCMASIIFSLSLNFKQMELYHSIPFFTFLFRLCFGRRFIKNFMKISLSVIVSFIIIWAPFGFKIPQVFYRLFPLDRGVFEDYVANFWCMFNTLYRIRSNINMFKICAIITILFALPSNLKLFLKPNFAQFQLTLVNTAFSFFLFSYQVHEKSILLVALPVLILLSNNGIQHHSLLIFSYWFLIISTFSLFPLLVLDNLIIAYFALQIFYLILFTICFSNKHFCIKISIFGTFLLSILSLISPVPTKLPYLFPLLISFYSFIHFFMFFLYFNYIQLFTNLRNKVKFS